MIDILLIPLLALVKLVLSLAVWVVIIDVVLSWLFITDVINRNNRFVISFADSLARITDIMLDPIRNNIPCQVGSVDISPFILILGLSFLENVVVKCIIRLS